MNTSLEPGVRLALEHLADGPEPTNMADRALNGARWVRWRRTAVSGVAVLVVAAAIPLLAHFGGRGGAVASPAPSAIFCTDVQPSGSQQTEPAQHGPDPWQKFFDTVVPLLPANPGYVKGDISVICGPTPPGWGPARAMLDVRVQGESGVLAVSLYADAQDDDPAVDPRACASRHGPTFLFCTDGTPSSPTIYGTGSKSEITVTAVYPDHRAAKLSSTLMADGEPGISADALRTAVSDPHLIALIPPR